MTKAQVLLELEPEPMSNNTDNLDISEPGIPGNMSTTNSNNNLQLSHSSNSALRGNTKLARTLSRISTTFSIRTAGQESISTSMFSNSTKVETRRKETLIISVIDLVNATKKKSARPSRFFFVVLIALGLLVYHIDRVISFYRIPEDDPSILVIILWIALLLIIVLHIGMAGALVTSSYSIRCTELSESSASCKKANFWIITSQLLLTLWIIKLTVFTSSLQFNYDLGALNIFIKDYTSIWFVLIFYSALIVFRGIGIYFVRKYIQELA